jgi:radical SAM superfamily enzyme YgiQ (UPF0313 family)
VSQATINVARDPSCSTWSRARAAASCQIGFESLSDESLASVSKQFNRPSRFAEDIAKLRATGIQVIALVMVGLDGDSLETFPATLRWLDENKISFLKLFTPAPYPGTKFHRDMQRGGRLLSDDWGLRLRQPNVRPLNMTHRPDARRLQDGLLGLLLRAQHAPPLRCRSPAGTCSRRWRMLVANAKVNGYLRRNPDAWGTIS